MGFKDRFKRIFGSNKKEENKIVQENRIVEFESSANESFRKDLGVILENEHEEIKLSSNSNVLFVCAGNTDRSPIAEAVFNQKAVNQRAFSAGVNAHNGKHASDNAIMVCANHGIDLSGHKTRNIANVPIHEMDLVLAATTNVRDTLKMLYPDLAIYTIREYGGGYSDLDISDPFGGDMSVYEKCFKEIDEAVSRILDVNVEVIDRHATADEITASPSKVRNFKYLDDLIHSGVKEIVLDSDIVLDDDEQEKYEYNGIKIDVDSLVIDGGGHTIDARQKAQIFIITGDADVTIKNIKLINGFADSGGAIYTLGRLTVIESEFSNNKSSGDEWEYGYGGAIYARKSSVMNISKSLFINNFSCEGGAIYNTGELTLRETAFIENESGINYAAIMNTGILKMHNCEVSHNTSPEEIICITRYCQINNSVFRGNDAQTVIDNYGTKATFAIFYCKFIENDVKHSIISSKGRYGVINSATFQDNLLNDGSRNIINENELTLTATQIVEEKSILNRGYILIRKSSQDFEGIIEGEGEFAVYENMIPQEDRFDFGHLDKKIHESPSREIVLDHDITLGNYERDFYEGGVELDIDGLTIDGGGKTIDARGKSRIFIITGRDITLKNMVFKNGHFYENIEYPLKSGGGALKIPENSTVTIENCKFIDNSSEDNCGAIDNSGDVTVAKSVFTDNSAGNCAGAIYNRGKMDIVESFLENNGAGNRGGAAYNEGEMTFRESSFTNNKSKENGGAVYNLGMLDITKSELANNSANRKGGGVYNRNMASISDGIFKGNSSGYDGGALYNRNEFDIVRAVFEGNSSGYDGGALFNLGKLEVMTSTLKDNSSVNEGGALFNAGKLNINDVKFLENFSEVGGGALSNLDEAEIGDSDFIRNASKMVGGAISSHGSDLNISDSNFNENSTEKLGGAIFSFMGQLNIIKSKFNANRVHSEGGAIYNDGASLSIIQTDFTGNSSEESAGAIFNSNGEADMSGCEMKGNSARVDGGAIVNTAELRITKSSIMNNKTSGIAGAIVNTANINLSESEISHNNAMHMAAAIDNYEGEMAISESIFTANEVKWDGGMEVSGSAFEDGEWNGSGVIYNDGGELSISASTFADNVIRGQESKEIWSNISDCEVVGCNFENNLLVNMEFEEEVPIEENEVYEDVQSDVENDFLEDVELEDENCPIEFEDENDIGDDSSTGFRYLDRLIHSGAERIDLESDIVLSDMEESRYSNGIMLDVDDLIIDGRGHTINARGRSRIFHCTGKNVSIKNVFLTKGSAENGGAIYNSGELTIFSSTLNENAAQEGGGAIYNDAGELTVVESKFEDNSAGYGGAIRNLPGSLNISQSCVLANNRAKSSGGAISNGGISNIDETAISHNTADSGGAITNSGKMTIKNSVIRQNEAKEYYGGAIDNGEELTIIDSEIRGNIAERDGGAIHNNCADLTLIGSSFSGNKANERGDAIFNYRERSFKVENCDLVFWDIVKYNEYDGD